MAIMRETTGIGQGVAKELSVTLYFTSQVHSGGPLQDHEIYETFSATLTLANDDVFTLRYTCRGIDCKALQKPHENILEEGGRAKRDMRELNATTSYDSRRCKTPNSSLEGAGDINTAHTGYSSK